MIIKEIKIASDEALEKAMDKVSEAHSENIDLMAMMNYCQKPNPQAKFLFVTLPNEETINAMQELRDGVKRYETIEELMKDLENP